MKKEFKEKLLAKYPSLFQDLRFIECGNGWYDLIDETCARIKFVERYDWDIKFIQIKEKFGTLRIYFYGANEQVEKIINCAECRSNHICEMCGSELFVKQRYPYTWIYTLCLKCYIKFRIKNEIRDFIWSIRFVLKKLIRKIRGR